jgi:hypothetical protein
VNRLNALGSAVAVGALLGLAGCTGEPPRRSPSPPASPSTSATPSTPGPTPTAPAEPKGPTLPAVRWDKVPRGSLPSGCHTVGATRVHVAGATVYATGPSLTCPHSRACWVRAVVKVAEYRGHGHWVYVTQVRPSAPARGAAAAQRTPVQPCRPGARVRPVASFVLTWPDGRQVRYRRIGPSARCA